MSALLLGPPPKLTSANILLTAPGEQQGILEENANTHIRWKSSHNGASRHFMDLKRRTLFLTPKRKAVGSNPAGCAEQPVFEAEMLPRRAILFLGTSCVWKLVSSQQISFEMMRLRM